MPHEHMVYDQRNHIVNECILRRMDVASHVVEHVDTANGQDMTMSVRPVDLTENGCISRASEIITWQS